MFHIKNSFVRIRPYREERGGGERGVGRRRSILVFTPVDSWTCGGHLVASSCCCQLSSAAVKVQWSQQPEAKRSQEVKTRLFSATSISCRRIFWNLLSHLCPSFT